MECTLISHMSPHSPFPSSLFRTPLALAFSLSLLTHAIGAREGNANGPTNADELAAAYKENAKAADARWGGKAITVTGTVQRLIAGDNTTKVAQVALKTGEGMPAVKVDFALVSDADTTYEFRVNNGKTLEVRTKERSTYPNSFSRFMPKPRPANWKALLSVGETATFHGQCQGRIVDIVVGNGELLKQGWNAGGGGALAAGGGGSTGEDPAAAYRRTETQQRFQMQTQQTNQQMNQQSSTQQMQQMQMNQRR